MHLLCMQESTVLTRQQATCLTLYLCLVKGLESYLTCNNGIPKGMALGIK